jgi:hypothetical protein
MPNKEFHGNKPDSESILPRSRRGSLAEDVSEALVRFAEESEEEQILIIDFLRKQTTRFDAARRFKAGWILNEVADLVSDRVENKWQ